MKALLIAAALTLTAETDAPKPIAAYAIAVQQHHGTTALRAVILQLDATHAVIGNSQGTEALTIVGGDLKTGDLTPVPLGNLFEMGKAAPIKRGVVVVCGEDPTT